MRVGWRPSPPPSYQDPPPQHSFSWYHCKYEHLHGYEICSLIRVKIPAKTQTSGNRARSVLTIFCRISKHRGLKFIFFNDGGGGGTLKLNWDPNNSEIGRRLLDFRYGFSNEYELLYNYCYNDVFLFQSFLVLTVGNLFFYVNKQQVFKTGLS